MTVERGEVFKIGAKDFAVIDINHLKETVTLLELDSAHPDDRVRITLSARALGVVLDSDSQNEE